MLAKGLSNEQIADRLGFRDKRTISRINGQIYTAWGLNETTTDEKIARTRVAIIVTSGRLIHWDENGQARPLIMGSYGIGMERILASAVELYGDDAGSGKPIEQVDQLELLMLQAGLAMERHLLRKRLEAWLRWKRMRER